MGPHASAPDLRRRADGRRPGLEHLAPVLRSEHERWDGCGYPDGLARETIPRLARIVFVCDAYHAIISDRPYRRAQSHEHAVAELEAGAGSQFCPETTGALLRVLAAAELGHGDLAA